VKKRKESSRSIGRGVAEVARIASPKRWGAEAIGGGRTGDGWEAPTRTPFWTCRKKNSKKINPNRRETQKERVTPLAVLNTIFGKEFPEEKNR